MDIENEGPRVPEIDLERGGNITPENVMEIAAKSQAIFMLRVVDGTWTMVVDEDFAAALRTIDPLRQMHVTSTVLALVRKTLQAITDAS